MKNLLLVAVFAWSSSVAPAATVSRLGDILFPETNLRLTPEALGGGWKSVERTGVGRSDQNKGCEFTGGLKGTAWLTGNARYWKIDEKTFAGEIEMTTTEEHVYESFGVSITLPYVKYAGGSFTTDTLDRKIPGEGDKPKAWLGGGTTKMVRFRNVDGGEEVQFEFGEPVQFSVQDSRKFSPSLLLRLGTGSAGKPLPKGHVFKLSFQATLPERVEIEYDDLVSIQAGSEWIPLVGRNDIAAGSVLDFSLPAVGLPNAHRPAGLYGRVIAKGENFEFEKQPSVPVRFYGADICSTANFLSAEESEKLAERFARMGYNTVRLHHQDGGLTEGDPTGTKIMPEPLDKFDRLVAEFIKRGLYISTDLFVSRSVDNRAVGIDKPGKINYNDYKLRVLVDETTFQELVSFTRQFLSHVNPYTGHRYADEPALAWLSLVNEGNVGNNLTAVGKDPQWAEAWKRWVEKRRRESPEICQGVSDTIPRSLAVSSPTTAEFKRFVAHLESSFFQRMRLVVAGELGCKALLTNWNGWTYYLPDQVTRSEYDFVDDHCYIDHPMFLGKPWQPPVKFQNGNVNPIRTAGSGMPWVAANRLLGRPFTLSEHNYGAPMRNRASFGLVSGTAAALQNWAGIWRFAYAHNRADALSDSPGPIRFFDISRDPVHRLTDRAVICLFRRGDMASFPAENTVSIEVDPADVSRTVTNLPGIAWANVWAGWQTRIGCVITDRGQMMANRLKAPEAYGISAEALAGKAGVPLTPSIPEQFSPADGRFTVSRRDGSFSVNTARTCGAYREGGSYRSAVLSFDLEGAEAAVWASSVDGQPLKSSSRIMLVHLPDVQNSGAEYDGRAREVLTAYGNTPHLVHNSRANVRLMVDNPDRCKVYRLALDGSRVAEVATKVADKALVFTAAVDADPASATLLYEIAK